jgi:hypothetical protein
MIHKLAAFPDRQRVGHVSYRAVRDVEVGAALLQRAIIECLARADLVVVAFANRFRRGAALVMGQYELQTDPRVAFHI